MSDSSNPLQLDGSATDAHAGYPSAIGDESWATRWTDYAEALRIASRMRSAAVDRAARRSVFEELGNSSLAIWRGIDAQRWADAESQGRYLWEEVITTTFNELVASLPSVIPVADRPILAWHLRLMRSSGAEQEEWVRRTLPAPSDSGSPEADVEGCLWSAGLLAPRLLAPQYSDGLRRITDAIDRRLGEDRQTSGASQRPLLELLEGLTQSHVVESAKTRARSLAAHGKELARHGYSSEAFIPVRGPDGTEYAFTELLAMSVPLFEERLGHGRSILMAGPTSSGKSHSGRIAAAYVLGQRKNVVVLLPTKSLVAQQLVEWREFFNGGPSDPPLNIIPVSRDYPQYDEMAARGDFDIALMIPEKLSAFIATGQTPLRRCGLVVVDELQHLNAAGRGPRFEALLTRIRALAPHVPMIGLSATITHESAASLRRWFEVDNFEPSGFISTQRRPVPLSTYAFDRYRLKGQDARVGESVRVVEWSLQQDIDRWKVDPDFQPQVAGWVLDVFGPTAALVARLLADADGKDQETSILCFVATRDQAEYLTKLLRTVLEHSPGVRPQSPMGNPFLGRYSRFSKREANRLNQSFSRLPRYRAWYDTREGLKTGVMYHTARLQEPRELARVVEEAYQDQIVRVLVATETLVLGLNFPTDVVIATNLVRPDGRGSNNVLTAHDLAQRLGRAGRLFFADSGLGYVMAATSPPDTARVRLDAPELQALVSAMPDAPEFTPEAAARAMTDVDAVYGYFVQPTDVGESIGSKIDQTFFGTLLLQDTVRSHNGLSDSELRVAADLLHAKSLRRAEGISAFDLDEIVRDLASHELIDRMRFDPSRWRVTDLGRSLALSNLEIEDAPSLRKIAAAAEEGAGELTLLNLAARSHALTAASWVAAQPRDNHPPSVEADLKTAIVAIARALAFPDERARLRAAFDSQEFLDWVDADSDLVGSGTEAELMRGRLMQDPRNLGLSTVNSLLRASVSYLWSKGVPIPVLLSCILRNTKVIFGQRESDGRDEWTSVKTYPVDIRQLGELMSYVAAASSELLRISSKDNSHLRLRNMTQALEHGVPHQLAPLLELRLPWLHRDRLTSLVNKVETVDYDELTELVEHLGRIDPDMTNEERRDAERDKLSDDELAELEQALIEVRAIEISGPNALHPDSRFLEVPRIDGPSDYQFGELAEYLDANRTTSAYMEELGRIFGGFGLTVVERTAGGLPALHVASDSIGVDLKLAMDALTLASCKSEADVHTVFVLGLGSTAGARDYLRSEGQPGAVAMSVWLLLESAAQTYRRWLKEPSHSTGGLSDVGSRLVQMLAGVSSVMTSYDISIALSSMSDPKPEGRNDFGIAESTSGSSG